MKYVYGPVYSRRLGRSLGVDITPGRNCSLDCVYCEEARPTTDLTLKGGKYAPTGEVISQIRQAATKELHYITFSGSGEPTLHKDLGNILKVLKGLKIPLAILTNSSLLHRDDVREDLGHADLVVPSLDAVSEDVFIKVNRPCPGLTSEMVLDGLRNFCLNYTGTIWLEILLVSGYNDGPEEINNIASFTNSLPIDKVHLNTISRGTTVPGCTPLSRDRLEEIAKFFVVPIEIYT